MLQFSQSARELKPSRWSVGEIIGVLKYRHRMIAVAILGCLAAAVLYLAVTPKKYIATAALLTETRQVPGEDDASADSAIDSTVIESQMEAVRSGSLALRVIDKLGLADDPEFGKPKPGFLSRLLAMLPSGGGNSRKVDPREVALDNLQAKLKIDRIGRSYVAEIDATSIDRDKAANIANAIADGYIEEQLDARQEAQLRANKWMEDRLADLRDQAARAEAARVAAMGGANAEQSSVTTDAPTGDLKTQNLAAKARIARASYDAYLNRYTQALQLQKVAIPTTSARVLTRAIPPNRPGSPRTTLVLVLSFIAGSTLGTLGAFGAEFFQTPIRSRSQVAAALRMRVFDALPLCKVRTSLFRRDRGMPIALIRDAGSGAIAAENELRKIKIAVSQFDTQKPARTIGVTSPNAQDGKTTIAYSLALLAAQAGSRTLLIDANAHNPTLARAFCEADSDSMTKFLMGDADNGLMVLRVADNLSVLGQHKPATSAHPADVLGSEAMQHALQRVQESFDFIIVDLPAMLDHVEARAIAPLLDRILVVSRWGSPIADLERCLENADTLSSRVLGIVINKSPEVGRKGVVRPIKAGEKAAVAV